MKKLILLVLTAFSTIFSYAQNVGIGTTTPDSSAQLEVHSTNKGFLPPRVALDSMDIASPIIKPAPGLLVYNTADTGNVIPGYYYWNDSSWYPLANKGKAFGDMQYWDGSKWIEIPIGSNNQVLTVCNGIPHWGACAGTDSLSPSDNPYEVSYPSNNPTTSGSGDTVIWVGAWTIDGNQVNDRFTLKFDLSGIPANATIDSAKLYLYAAPYPNVGNGVDADYGTANACYVQRITANWSPSAINWNSPPSTTTVDEATIPQSTSFFQNDIINVTALIQDIQINGNYGFNVLMQNETYYNIRQYVSSYNANASLHPTLVVSYH